ncbi:bacillithiol biosynthesis deacetylase BshB1 [Rubinisphaera margarita]|uniref:bacillithiol biosynthesis deacetylase BshB1 n=1 Tax=Rubinisphaera margarita TaxID=2909586 RepID=UPI001EE79516|nr:bacillithiol biosynthesis deacetylase BshB1 [Rubinisphaera margarita]MCG6156810.1 bacillithiol biosynthesis deacetylase BshB1 [Rubinisphaera margarita]
MLDLLVVATHPDDAEISVGGTMLKAIAEGLQVGILDLTSGEPTPHGTNELRRQETATATKVLGVHWRDNLGLPNRQLEDTLDARRALTNVFRTQRPKMILAPWPEDAHPDHVRASQLCDDARFWSKLSRTDLEGEPYWPSQMFYYFSVHLRIHPKPSVVIDVSDYIDQKMASIACYESQVTTGRDPSFPTPLDDIRDRARYWGWSIHSAYGEPLLSREEIRISSVKGLF